MEQGACNASPASGSHPQQQQQQDEQQPLVQQQGDDREAAAAAANGVAGVAQPEGRARRGGRVAQLQAEVAGGGETSGSDGEYLPGRELTIGTAANPYQTKRPKSGRTGQICCGCPLLTGRHAA